MSEEYQWMINKQILRVLVAITRYGAGNAAAEIECAKLECMLDEEESPANQDE